MSTVRIFKKLKLSFAFEYYEIIKHTNSFTVVIT